MRARWAIVGLVLAGSAVLGSWGLFKPAKAGQPLAVYGSVQELGSALFHDPNLSKNRSQSCSTCHQPEAGFSDQRDAAPGNAASLGDDGISLGDRNAPSAAYAHLTPAFGRDKDGQWMGGQFLDGRASRLADQAGGPPLNPLEMGMESKAAVAARLTENPDYMAAFVSFFGAGVTTDPEQLYAAMTQAIASFEQTPDVFSPFDSRYDRYLRGEVTFTDQEELGRTLFFSKQFANCSICHSVDAPDGTREHALFSNHRYFNIGVPENAALRAVNGHKAGEVDVGLMGNPAVAGDPATKGQFKVPGLRNVAVTGPYMHNGVFKDLRTVILFYNKYNSKKKSRQINPETGKPWDRPEIADNLALTELETGPGLDDQRVDALVAFLKTLTDKRYEGLVK